ncbi:tRNA (guanine(37)-N1)-methyltransferase 1 isoform X2 [Tripterygium wilfordii]|uniref:tRNA (guanine(37)-N1)-methyltransferase 1 isoform X2 n=1 Tax=Tripterygium wilfordii TaxID=458696 RepID=UPI0018F81712|nr:tRNA (guanine(37)-N1)-methyltransferase 1 isoform X2 [Tripterygium wilfordii]
MLTKVLLRPNTLLLSFPLFSATHRFFFAKLTTSTATNTDSLFSAQSLSYTASYGPSLHKGKIPAPQFPNQHEENLDEDGVEEDGDGVIDEDSFTRIFDVSALRVPARDCSALESRIRGHLLNWARIRNIARVPGDDVEDDDPIKRLIVVNKNVDEEETESSLDSLNRRIYGRAESDGEALSPVLYRDKLAREFNSRGYARFRHLARISRPNKKKGKGGEGEEKRKGKERREIWTVEVVDEEVEELKGLLGEGFKGRRKWSGPTRLLLLDERYAGKGVEDLPEAIKVLEVLLPKNLIIPSAFETVGHIAHLNLRDEHLPFKKLIAKVVLDKNRPKIQTVVNKIDAIHSDYRTMQLEVLAGNRSLVTTLVENGLRFHVDLATVYWNSRLATERQRLLSGFTSNDIVCDVFSGVGPISIAAAKIVKRVYANDLNPYAVDYLERNSILNKVERRIKVFNMDGRRFIHAMFASEKAQSITQVVMNLPNDAAESLDAFKGIYRDKPKSGEFTLPRIHVYGFSKAQDPEFDFHERIRIALSEVAVDVEMRRVRLVAPGKWMLCASFVLPLSVAYAKPRLDL